MNTRKLLLKLAKRFPKRIAKANHDFVGVMTETKLPEEIHKVLLCLDFDHEVLPKVKEFKPDLILTHHPFIYGTRSWVLSHDPVKKNCYDEIVKLGIPVYSMHTNFDTGEGGMNDALANALGLLDIKTPEKEPMMRGGRLPHPMDVEEFAKYAKERLNVDWALLVQGGKQVVESVAVVGGAGSGRYRIAKEAGYDIFISGDIPHHLRREIILDGYNFLDMPHEIEKIFIPTMKNILLDIDPSLDILMVDHEKLPKVI